MDGLKGSWTSGVVLGRSSLVVLIAVSFLEELTVAIRRCLDLVADMDAEVTSLTHRYTTYVRSTTVPSTYEVSCREAEGGLRPRTMTPRKAVLISDRTLVGAVPDGLGD